MRVIVTQARDDAQRLEALLEARGHVPIPLPMIRFEATGEPVPAGPFDVTLLTSPRALRFALEAAGPGYAWGRVLALAPTTRDRARQLGLPVDDSVDATTGDELARALPDAPPPLRVLIPRSDLAGERLGDALRARGHRPQSPVLYRTLPVDYDAAGGDGDRVKSADSIIFTSPSTARHFVARFGVACLSALRVAVIGATTRRAVEALGGRVDVEPSFPDLAALVAELEDPR